MNFDFDSGTIDAIQYLDATQVPPNGGTAGVLKIIGNGALQLPTGTTAEQPSGLLGMVRGNNTTSLLEFYTGAAWAPVITGNPDGSIDAQVNHRVNTYANLSTLDGGNGEISVMSDLRGVMVHNGVPGGAVPVISDYVALDVNMINYIGNIGQIDPVAKVIELWSADFIVNAWSAIDTPMHVRVQLTNGYFFGQTVRLLWTPTDLPPATLGNYPYTRIMSVTPCDVGSDITNTYGLFLGGAGLYGGHGPTASCRQVGVASLTTSVAPQIQFSPFYRDYWWDGIQWLPTTSSYTGRTICTIAVTGSTILGSIMIPPNCAFTATISLTGTMHNGAAGALVGQWIVRGVYPDYNRNIVAAVKSHAVYTIEHVGANTSPTKPTDVTIGLGTISGASTGGRGVIWIRTTNGIPEASASAPAVFTTHYTLDYSPL